MRHHSTSIVGPGLDGPEMRECKCMDGPGVRARFYGCTVRDGRQIERCFSCGAETDVGPALTGCIKASDLEPPDPYPSDLLSAIPWAKEVGLRLVQGRDHQGDSWLYVTDSLIHCPLWKKNGWWPRVYKNDNEFYGYFPSREAALKSPPPKPPGFVEAPAQPSVGERLGAVARDEWLATGAVARWDRIALAVRREVLKEVFAEEDVEAAAKAMWNATLPGITWDELREASRKPIGVQAAAALSAALASRVARESKVTP